ncbi:type IX secretion system motor protein PorL/GldL [Sunxiuqinia indica]|uniref:type IX secretion system motor protein PorL/GldL n=1 Tax=Sunxiuqinia indica TaxID=2692584 RepID=UPI001359206A|nr:gliding motility protein GldL [Sunxiuqinia indica]
MNIGEIIQNKRWKVFTGYVYNLGASIVLLGALFKLQHWSYSGLLLIVGLCTEAFIFFISAFEPPLEMPEWSKVYPELKEDYDADEAIETDSKGGFGDFWNKADISPELLTKVSKGLTDLSNTASSISEISSATLATDLYVRNLTSASESMSTLSEINNQANDKISDSVSNLVSSYSKTAKSLTENGDQLLTKLSVSGEEFANQLTQTSHKLASSYEKAAGSIDSGIDSISKSSASYGENLNRLNKNLETLNSSYESQLKETNAQLQSSQKFFTEMAQMNEMIALSTEEIKKYKSNAEELNKHLEALNSVYGNMLGAMNYKK